MTKSNCMGIGGEFCSCPECWSKRAGKSPWIPKYASDEDVQASIKRVTSTHRDLMQGLAAGPSAFRGKLQCVLGLEGTEVSDDDLLNAVRRYSALEAAARRADHAHFDTSVFGGEYEQAMIAMHDVLEVNKAVANTHAFAAGLKASTGRVRRRCVACDQIRDDVGDTSEGTLPMCKQCAKAHRMGYRCGQEFPLDELRSGSDPTDWKALAITAYQGWKKGDNVLDPMAAIQAAISAAPKASPDPIWKAAGLDGPPVFHAPPLVPSETPPGLLEVHEDLQRAANAAMQRLEDFRTRNGMRSRKDPSLAITDDECKRCGHWHYCQPKPRRET